MDWSTWYSDGYKFVACEFLNLINIMGQMWFLNSFLSFPLGQFLTYGPEIISLASQPMKTRIDPMAKVLPKMVKCTFVQYDPAVAAGEGGRVMYLYSKDDFNPTQASTDSQQEGEGRGGHGVGHGHQGPHIQRITPCSDQGCRGVAGHQTDCSGQCHLPYQAPYGGEQDV